MRGVYPVKMLLKAAVHIFGTELAVIRLVLCAFPCPPVELAPELKLGEFNGHCGIETAFKFLLCHRRGNVHIVGYSHPDLVAVDTVLKHSRVRVIKAEVTRVGFDLVQSAVMNKFVDKVADILLGVFSDNMVRRDSKRRQHYYTHVEMLVQVLIGLVQIAQGCRFLLQCRFRKRKSVNRFHQHIVAEQIYPRLCLRRLVKMRYKHIKSTADSFE